MLAFQANTYDKEVDRQPLIALEYMIMDIAGNIVGHSDDETAIDDQGRLHVDLASGQTYYVLVAAQNRNDVGRYRLSLSDGN